MEYRVISEEVERLLPKMGKDIEDFISNCAVCKSYQPNRQKEPMISHEIPTRPWEKVGCDPFHFEDNHYLVCVDYHSDYFELDRICDKKGKEVISRLKSQFARHGIPVQVLSDNGPPLSSKEFQKFVSVYEFEHLTSSPRYPQSNGKVENAVKIAQSIMKKARDAGSDPNLSPWITGTLQLRESEVLLPSDCLVGGLEHCCQLLQDYLFRKQFRVSCTS